MALKDSIAASLRKGLSSDFSRTSFSRLSPCVLPLVPVIVGTAVAAHPFGAIALAAGLALSFTTVGLFAATVGFSIGLDAEWFCNVAAILLVAFGAVLLSATLQRRFASATSSLSTFGDDLLSRMKIDGLTGQLAIGVVLGLIWAPPVGPTLGASATLASQGSSFGQVAVVMTVCGLGARLPLALIGLGSRSLIGRNRGRLLKAGALGKSPLGPGFAGTGGETGKMAGEPGRHATFISSYAIRAQGGSYDQLRERTRPEFNAPHAPNSS